MAYLKRSALFGFLLLLSSYAFAQIHIGINGGGGINNTVSLRAGIPVEIPLSGTFSLRSGGMFTQQHNPAILRKLDPFRDYRRVTINYIGIPLQLQTELPLRSFSVYALAGPQVNYGISISTSFLKDGAYGSEHLDFESLRLSRFDIGLNAGFGVATDIRNNCRLFAEVMFLINFFDIDQNPSEEIYNEGKVFNLGVQFPIR
jgi:hypothetical protein